MIAAPLLLALASLGCAAQHETSIFGEPLFVNTKRVSDDQIRLALIYGPCRQKLELLETNLIVEGEIARQAHQHAGSSVVQKYLVTDADFEAEYAYNIDEFRKTYPTLDFETEVRRSFRSIGFYREYLRVQQRFDRVFLPDDPAEWPPTTIEAILADDGGGQVLLADARESYVARLKAAAKNGGNLPRQDSLYLSFLRDIVRDAKLRCMTVKRHDDGIDPRMAFWVDMDGDGGPELQLTIDELWQQVRDTVTEQEIDEAKQWFVTSTATRDRLRSVGALLTEEEAREALVRSMRAGDLDAHAFAQSALYTFGFPSVESYTDYCALRAGFERWIASQVTNGSSIELSPALARHLSRANLDLGFGQVDMEVLLVSAMDIPRFSWKAEGWEQARHSALVLLAQYERDPTAACWSRLLDEHSDFWDSPPPQDHDGHHRTDCRELFKHGRFGQVYHRSLMSRLDETAYSEWVTGECITDRIFFDQPEGTVAGPFRGPLGWYLTRVNKRTPPARPLDLSNERHLELLKEDYLRSAFIQYSKEAVAQADIRGFRPL